MSPAAVNSASASPDRALRSKRRSALPPQHDTRSSATQVHIPIRGGTLSAATEGPARAVGVVVLVHGSGVTHEDQHAVARQFRRAGLRTVCVDLLQGWERGARHNVFDVELQAQRLAEVAAWLSDSPASAHLPIGYYATGIGASAALLAAARVGAAPKAIVVRDGRPDEALFWLPRVTAPTLFIVSDNAGPVRQQAEAACARLAGEHEIVVASRGRALAPGRRAADSGQRRAAEWFLQGMTDTAGTGSTRADA